MSQESVVSGDIARVRGYNEVVNGVCGVYVGNKSILMAHLTRANRNGSDGVEDCGGDIGRAWDGRSRSYETSVRRGYELA